MGGRIMVQTEITVKGLPEEDKFKKLQEFSKTFGFKTGKDYSVKKVYMLYTKKLENVKGK